VAIEPGATPVVVVPDVRDYTRINAELIQLLDAGHPVIRLSGVRSQRLLASGLRGAWHALVVVEGDAGPELAADLDAPNLSIVCTGSAKDGAGRGLRSGQVLVTGDVDAVAGYAQSGGCLVVAGSAGPRAGLDHSGGLLVLGGSVGRLLGERQRGGEIVVLTGPVGRFAGRARTGGKMLAIPQVDDPIHVELGRIATNFGAFWPVRLLRDAPVG